MMADTDISNSQEDMTLPWECLALEVSTDSIHKEGFNVRFSLTDEQKAQICDSLELLDIKIKKASLKLKPLSKDRYALKGEISARVKQTCSVTLEPVESEFSSEINAQFWPDEALARIQTGNQDIEVNPYDEEPEPIENGKINVGRYIYETIATSIDPYPRKKDAEFEWEEEGQDSEEDKLADNPFAALKSLQSKNTDDSA